MVSLRTVHLEFRYEGGPSVWSDVNLHLHGGWTGLVGENGAGKTTFLKVLAGMLAPTSGHLQWMPEDIQPHYCPQECAANTDAIEAFAHTWDNTAMRWKSLLNLQYEDYLRWPQLSSGERKRWQVGAALAAQSPVVLLDEPTNHLDGSARRVVLEALNRFSGIGLLVSHDRAFLDELTQSTLVFRRRTARLYTGHYSEARLQWKEEEEQELEALTSLQQQRKHLQRRWNDRRKYADSADARVGARSRIQGPKDSDSRSMAAKERVRSAASSLSRRAGATRQQLEQVEAQLEHKTYRGEVGGAVKFALKPADKRVLLRLNRDEIAISGKILMRDVHASIWRDSRIHLQGPNGSGKSTLARMMIDALELPAERVLYLPQACSSEQAMQDLEGIRAWSPQRLAELMQILAALGVEPESLLGSRNLTPGIRRKLRLGLGIVKRVWLLVLDEPTNHMDLPSIERLQEALCVYEGALVLISHDATFAARCTSETWRIEKERLVFESRTSGEVF